MTVAEWCRNWHEETDKKRVRFSTWQCHGYLIENQIILGFGEKELEHLTTRDIQKFIVSKRKAYADTTVHNIYRLLHLILQEAVAEKLIAANPADGQDVRIKAQCEVNLLTDYQLAEYLEAAENSGCGAMLRLMADYGLRQKEVCTLRWSDLNITDKTLIISQTRGIEKGELLDCSGDEHCRKIRLDKEMVALLIAEHKRHPGSEILFIHPGTLKPYTTRMLRQRHKEVLSQTDLPEFDLSDLHHSYAIRQLKSGVEEKEVAIRIGKSRTREMRSYYKIAVKKQEQKRKSKKDEPTIQEQKQMADQMSNLLQW